MHYKKEGKSYVKAGSGCSDKLWAFRTVLRPVSLQVDREREVWVRLIHFLDNHHVSWLKDSDLQLERVAAFVLLSGVLLLLNAVDGICVILAPPGVAAFHGPLTPPAVQGEVMAGVVPEPPPLCYNPAQMKRGRRFYWNHFYFTSDPTWIGS